VRSPALAVAPNAHSRIGHPLRREGGAGRASWSSPPPAVQRQIRVTGSANVVYGVDIDAIRENAKSQKLRDLFFLCANSANTHLLVDTYTGPRSSAGFTDALVKDSYGRSYELEYPGDVDWAAIDSQSEITIRVGLNSARVAGRAENIETILHELVVHAAEYVPFIKRMREAHKNAIRGIWWNAADSASGELQHQRLGEGFNRALSADIGALAGQLHGEGLGPYLDAELSSDVRHHNPFAPHYQGE
jgi:hypothetical protein